MVKNAKSLLGRDAVRIIGYNGFWEIPLSPRLFAVLW